MFDQDGLANPTATLFAAAQKQIYNLMKFDSFSRFLKSDLYKESLVAEMSGRQLPYSDSLDQEVMLDSNAVSSSTTNDKSGKKNKSTAEDATSRRRSLLPWSKDRSKSKERNSNKNSGSSIGSQKMAKEDSRSSIHGVEEAPSGDNCTLARVILPDKATTVVQTRKGETIRAMVARLLEKRGLRLTSFDVFAMEGSEQGRPLDLAEDCSTLGCTEVRVEPRVLFRLELPSSKSIGVKAKPAKVVRDVLGPILQQYGWQLDRVSVRREGRVTSAVDLDSTVASIDNSRLTVAEISGQGSFRGRAHSASGMADEIRSLGSNSSVGSLGERRVRARLHYMTKPSDIGHMTA